MATQRTRPTKLRLTINFRTGARSKEQIRGFASVLVQEVAVNAADEMWDEIRTKIAKRLERDVFAEIALMARYYKQFTIGVSPNRAGLYGTLTPASAFAEGMSKFATYKLGSGAAGSWAPRQRSYLKKKQRQVGHKRWFLHNRLLSDNMGRGKFWTGVFGPVKVDIHRVQNMSPGDALRIANSQPNRTQRLQHLKRLDTGASTNTGNSLRVHVASIRVSALEAITPAMLPALRSGDINDMPADGRKTGLIGKFPGDIAMHLAGSGKSENFVPYRHTIEPFLGFVLTRAIPNAVARRIQEGLGASIRFDRSTSRGEKFTDYSFVR